MSERNYHVMDKALTSLFFVFPETTLETQTAECEKNIENRWAFYFPVELLRFRSWIAQGFSKTQARDAWIFAMVTAARSGTHVSGYSSGEGNGRGNQETTRGIKPRELKSRFEKTNGLFILFPRELFSYFSVINA